MRRDAPTLHTRARTLLGTAVFGKITPSLLERAVLLGPFWPRSLDAIHLATALSLGDELDGLVTYDERLARAARACGIPTFAPS